MNKHGVVSIVMIALSYGVDSSPIQNPQGCETLNHYENRNQINPRPLVVKRLRGRVKGENGEPLFDACLSLFTQNGTLRIATVKTDGNGNFDFESIGPGQYRLVTRDFQKAFCAANTPVRIVKYRNRKKSIIVHLQASNVDRCSYADYK